MAAPAPTSSSDTQGFELSTVFPVNSADFPLLIEADGPFIRAPLLEEARRQTTLPPPTR